MTTLTDRQIKTKATKAEYSRVFDNYNLPGKDIVAECSDGLWVRKSWRSVNTFGWGKWTKN